MANFSGPRNLVPLAIGLIVGLGGGAALVYFFVKPSHESTRSDTGGPRAVGGRVAARGRIEPEGGVINLAAPSPDILKKIEVKDGQDIAENQELAVLASHDLRQIETELAMMQLKEAEDRRKKTLEHLTAQQKETDAKVRQLETQGAIDIKLQESKISVLERQSSSAETLLVRMKAARSYPQQELDQQELMRAQAEQELNSARAILAKLKDANAVNLEVARAQRESSAAGIARAEAETPLGSLKEGVKLSGEKLALTIIRSPLKGTVLKAMAHEGEMVGSQPVFQVADTSKMVAVAEVYETDVPAVREWFRSGKPVIADVELKLPGNSQRLRGRVVSVGTLVAKNSIFSTDPRQDVDRRVVEVRIKLDDEFNKPAAEYINMQADVTIFDPNK
jgi:HlyD family secretion protein